MKRLAERNVVIAFLLTLALMLAVRFTVHGLSNRNADTSRKVEHEREVLIEVRAAFSSLQDAENGTRGFIITGQDRFLEPFAAATVNCPVHFARLRELLKDDPAELQLVGEAEQLSRDKIEHATNTVRLYRSEGRDAASALVATGRGKVIMDAFRQKIADLESRENTALAGNQEAVKIGRDRSFVAFVSVTIFEFSLIASGFFFIRRYIKQRDRTKDSLLLASAFQNAILNGANSAIIAVDTRGIVTHFNHAAEELLEYRSGEVVGKASPALWHDEKEIAARARVLTKELGRSIEPGFEVFSAKPSIGQSERGEWTFIAKSGQRIPVLLSVSSVVSEGGALLGFCGIGVDISDQREAERSLRDARDAAEAASRTKSQFLANMSHELRTPLNAIIGYSEMLAEDAQSAGEAQTVDDLRKINRAGKQLLALINDVLDLSKVEAGKMSLHIETFSIPLLVQEVINTIRPTLSANGNKLSVEIKQDVTDMRGDVTKLRQVLLNLLSNASKFSNNASVELSAYSREQGGGGRGKMICFEIRDHGIGMTKEQVENLFQAFVQADSSTSRKFGGTGLGLAISREFCQMMGGDILVKSEPGKGSCFTVCLPQLEKQSAHPPEEIPTLHGGNVKSPETSAAPDKSDSPAKERDGQPAIAANDDDEHAGGGTVLVIDDDPAVRDLLRRMLEPDGYSVALATSGDQALTLARELSPIAITLDVIMPGMDGWAVLNALKADARTASIPVIMLSILDDRKQGYALGATSILSKPVDRLELIRALEPFREQPRRSILVVEDNADIAEMLIRTLHDDGWETRHAENGRVALAAMQEQRPALILLDLMMPLMDGFEFASTLRQNPAWRDVPVIVLTAKELSDSERDHLNGDVEKILRKASVGHNEILRELHDTIENRQQSQARSRT